MILELIVCCLARLNDKSYNLPEECLELFQGTPTNPRARREQVWVANLNLNLRRPGGRGGTGTTREGRCSSPSSRHPGAIHGPPAHPGAEHLPPAPTGQFVARPPIPGQFIDHPPLWGHTDAPPPPPPWGNSSSPGASRGRTSTTRARGALRHPPAPVGENNARPSPAGKIVDRAPPSRRAEHRHPVARGVRRPPGARCSSTAFHGLLILTNWFLVLFFIVYLIIDKWYPSKTTNLFIFSQESTGMFQCDVSLIFGIRNSRVFSKFAGILTPFSPVAKKYKNGPVARAISQQGTFEMPRGSKAQGLQYHSIC